MGKCGWRKDYNFIKFKLTSRSYDGKTIRFWKNYGLKVLLEALERVQSVEGVSYVIDPKAILKDALYDPEWVESYVTKRFVIDVIWSFSGNAKLNLRAQLGDFVRGITIVDLSPVSPGTSYGLLPTV
ncbi:hypothetical protein C1646_759956 [Rhizophagus diaphanus]|nr:hypothetical protein C1646_759956 [Rhizophagus diaphanus] [Rhizophagus sp. MUCL 43196]